MSTFHRVPMSSILKIMHEMSPDLCLRIEKGQVQQLLERMVQELAGISTTQIGSEAMYDALFLELNIEEDDLSEHFRFIMAQEATRLHHVYFFGGDPQQLERPYVVPDVIRLADQLIPLRQERKP